MNATFQTDTSAAIETAEKEFPFVSIIMPVFNEENFIERTLAAVLEQDYPSDKLEVIVADGMSSDHTREIIRCVQDHFQNVRLIDNPERIVPTGLNRAIASARGEIIVRLDGHCEYPKDYVRRVVELRGELGADSVGGVLVPMGVSYTGKAIAAAYYSPVGLGSTALKASATSERVREVDTVHGGCWKRERLLAVGGFDAEMVRNQDDELSFRLRKNSGKIFQTLAIPVKYHVRDSFKKLFLQFAQYGYWKVRVVRKHPQQASARHFAPALFVSAVISLAILGLFFEKALWGFVGLLGIYFSILSMGSLIQALGSSSSLHEERMGRGLRRGEFLTKRASSPRPSPPSDGGEGANHHDSEVIGVTISKPRRARSDAPYHDGLEISLWPGIIFALMTIHFGYGVGFVLGCARACFGRLPTDRIFERVTR